MSADSTNPAPRTLLCDGRNWGQCSGTISHIDEKGFIYCATHGARRRNSGRRCRQMRPWELRLIETGKPLPSYEPKSKPSEDETHG